MMGDRAADEECRATMSGTIWVGGIVDIVVWYFEDSEVSEVRFGDE